jgi:hypothetical protein
MYIDVIERGETMKVWKCDECLVGVSLDDPCILCMKDSFGDEPKACPFEVADIIPIWTETEIEFHVAE